jgi:hypothetical protein
MMAKEIAVPQADPDKSGGELTEGRTDPTEDVPTGELHRRKSQMPQQPLGPYSRDQTSGENPEVDNIMK